MRKAQRRAAACTSRTIWNDSSELLEAGKEVITLPSFNQSSHREKPRTSHTHFWVAPFKHSRSLHNENCAGYLRRTNSLLAAELVARMGQAYSMAWPLLA